MEKTKYCKHCASVIDFDSVICVKCGKQVEELKRGDTPVIINNSSSSSASSSASAGVGRYVRRPWHLSVMGIVIIGILTGGIYWFIGPFLRMSWNRKWGY